MAVSFYNLIPCCATCNHLKSDDDSFLNNIVSPYEINDNFKFSFRLNGSTFKETESIQSINVNEDEIEIFFKNEIKQNTECFALNRLYQENHADAVMHLIRLKKNHPNTYIKELASYGFSENEIYRFILNNYPQEKDFHKQPLSKLVNDIATELQLLN